MKYSEMNERQKKAFKNIMYCTQQYIGGLENTMEDNSEDSEAYKNAQAELSNHEELVATIYELSITNLYDVGSERFGAGVEKILKDIRFCGKEWLMERVDKRVTKEGY